MVHLDTAEFEETAAPPEQPNAAATPTVVREHWRLSAPTLRHVSRGYRERCCQLFENIGSEKTLFNLSDYVTVSEQPSGEPGTGNAQDRSGTLIRVRAMLSNVWVEQWTPTSFHDEAALAAESAGILRDVMRSARGPERTAEKA